MTKQTRTNIANTPNILVFTWAAILIVTRLLGA